MTELRSIKQAHAAVYGFEPHVLVTPAEELAGKDGTLSTGLWPVWHPGLGAEH